MNRRAFLNTAAGIAAISSSTRAAEDADVRAVHAEALKQHEENVGRLQNWIRQPSIAAENIGMEEGCKTMMRLLQDAGFGKVSRVQTKGFPGVTGILDAGAPRTLGVYFMYDVKQVEASEWTSPPWEAALLEKPGVGKVVMGRGAVNQKGPQSAFLAALHAFRRSGRKLPVNLVLVAEGEEEIGSENLAQIVQNPNVFGATAAIHGRNDAVCKPGTRRQDHHLARREGRCRSGTRLYWREVGSRPEQGCSFLECSAVRQPDVALGAGASHAGGEGRLHARHRRVRR
jgi:acetylornithine deacetylase/succinyl-diaminopimelate desuccinylase-like protein